MISFLFIDTEQVWRGGQDQLLSLIKGLYRRGHEVHLVCQPKTLLEAWAQDYGIAVHPIRIRSEFSPISWLRLVSLLLKLQPDILAFNTPRAILLGTLASRLAPVGATIVFRRVNFPLRKNWYTRIKYTWGIDCIVAISDSIRAQLQLSGIPPSKIRTIYEGMDLSLYPKRTQLKDYRWQMPLQVGTVAHLSREKGLNYLIEAAAMIPDVHKRLRFLIVGEGNARQELQDLVCEKGLQDLFRFVGFRTDIASLIKSFDIFVLPSLSEGLSSAILEAMAASLPIVATQVGGIPELISDGDNGLLVPPADPAALARAIQRLAENPHESLLMGQRGRLRIEERFTLERKILETEQLCALLLNRRLRT